MPRSGSKEKETVDYYLHWFEQSAPDGVTFKLEAKVPSYIYHVISGPVSLYRLDLGCYHEGRLVGGLEVRATSAVETKKWVFLRTFGYDVVEVPVLDPSGRGPEYPDAVALGTTFPGGPATIRFQAPFFTRRPYHPILEGYPPLEEVQTWEQRTPRDVLSAYDQKIAKALTATSVILRPLLPR